MYIIHNKVKQPAHHVSVNRPVVNPRKSFGHSQRSGTTGRSKQNGHLDANHAETGDGHHDQWEYIPQRKRPLFDRDVFLFQYRTPEEAGKTGRECEAHGANVARDGERDRRCK